MRPLELLLLCNFPPRTGETVRDHILAHQHFSQHRIHIEKIRFADISPFVNLSRFDGIIIHYTVVACYSTHLSEAFKKRLRSFRGLKAMFIQDEYRFVDRTIATMREIGVNLLFTCVPGAEIEKVYPSSALPGLIKMNVLTGYVPEALVTRQVRPFSDRPIDIGYRGRKVPEWLGRLGQEKWRIAAKMQEEAGRYGLATDISYREQDRFYGEDWIAFVSRCKAMLGVESGASVFDFTGEIEHNVARHLARHPDATFDELEGLYFAAEEGKIRLNQISPRCFEAAALRTLMILYEGSYSGILKPWRHYVPLKKDHSNLAEVVAILRDPVRAGQIVDQAYREIALDPRYSFERAVSEFDTMVERRLEPAMMRTLDAYGPRALGFARAGKFVAPYYLRAIRRAIYARLVRLVRYLFVNICLGWLPNSTREHIRDRIRRWRGIDVAEARDFQIRP